MCVFTNVDDNAVSDIVFPKTYSPTPCSLTADQSRTQYTELHDIVTGEGYSLIARVTFTNQTFIIFYTADMLHSLCSLYKLRFEVS